MSQQADHNTQTWRDRMGENYIANLKILVATAYDIIDKELLPNVATMAIQDFGRLNQFMMDATPIKKEIEENG